MKKIVIAAFLVLLPCLVFAQNSFRTGAQIGTNMETSDGYAFTLGAHADVEVLPSAGLIVGAQMDFTLDSATWSSNPSAYVQWIMPFRLFNLMSPFVKGNLGMFVLHKKDSDDLLMSGALASVSAGLDFTFGNHFYIEPSFSFGYPFMWSFQTGAGWKF